MAELYVPAPITGSSEFWSSASIWDQPQLSSPAVAGMLGVTPAAVRQLLLRSEAAGFPRSARRVGSRHEWSPAQIYEYVLDRKPRKHSQIPSFYPQLTRRLVQPAVFVAAEQWNAAPSAALPNPAECSVVVQYWQPCDGRDEQIEILYPAASGYKMDRATGVEIATRYAQRRFRSTDGATQAVALVTDELRPTPDGRKQAAIIVVESERRMYPPTCTHRAYRIPVSRERGATVDDCAAVAVYEIGWFDLGSILHTDLPWWPPVLRSPDLMWQWRPAQAPTAVQLEDRHYRPAVLRALATNADDRGSTNASLLRDVVERANRRIENLLYPAVEAFQLPAGQQSPSPGILQAAVPASAGEALPDPLTASEISWLLRQPLRGVHTAAPDLLWRLQETWPVMFEVENVSIESCGGLAREWASRLEQAECWSIGHEFVKDRGTLGVLEDGWAKPHRDELVPLIDPFNAASWAVRTGTGDIHFTVGRRAFGATGQLVEAEFNASLSGDHVVTFFRDSVNTIWPLPYVDRANQRWALPDVLHSLRKNANVEVEERPTELRQIPGFSPRLLYGTLPWHLSSQDVSDFFDV